MLGAMGLTMTNQIPKLQNETRTAEWEVPDPETPNRNLLRPDFNISFHENSPWHTDAINFVRNNICRFGNSITAAIIGKKSDAQILESDQYCLQGLCCEAQRCSKKDVITKMNKADLKPGVSKKNMEPKAVNGRQARRKKRDEVSHLSSCYPHLNHGCD